ncbi:MAG: hypothetical protein U0V74_14465 [Chitinophagales bacterium]
MRYLLLPLFFFLCHTLPAQQEESIFKPARVIFYNTENLFDTINNPDTDDEEFLPSSKQEWNSAKYQTKLTHVAKVVSSLCDTIAPLVIGLAEVENNKVLEDLIAQPALKKFNLKIVHHDSPDERGIDVALLYNADVIEEVFDSYLHVELDSDKTRDILYYKGFIDEAYPIWFFVNHWPSRRDGVLKSEVKRMTAEKVLRAKIDNLYLGEPYSRVVVMGDFNDNPTDSATTVLTRYKAPVVSGQRLQNLMLPLYKAGKYSLSYRGKGDLFDQFMVSENLVDKESRYYIRSGIANIYSPSWLLFNHPTYGPIPDRTYANGKYTGGYSDHLPVYFDVVFK